MPDNKVALIKAFMLSETIIQLDKNIDKHELYSSTGNIGKSRWIFIRLSKRSRVRMTLSETARLRLVKSDTNDYFIQDSQIDKTIIKHVMVECILAHAPEQLFFYCTKIVQVVVYFAH